MFAFFSDPALTKSVSRLPLTSFRVNGSSEALPAVVYFGNVDSSVKVSGVSVNAVDGGAGGLSVGDVRLALSADGLSSATPGAALAIGDVSGGVGQQVTIWVAVDVPVGAVGVISDLSLTTNPLTEVLV